MAEVMKYEDFKAEGSEAACKVLKRFLFEIDSEIDTNSSMRNYVLNERNFFRKGILAGIA